MVEKEEQGDIPQQGEEWCISTALDMEFRLEVAGKRWRRHIDPSVAETELEHVAFDGGLTN